MGVGYFFFSYSDHFPGNIFFFPVGRDGLRGDVSRLWPRGGVHVCVVGSCTRPAEGGANPPPSSISLADARVRPWTLQPTVLEAAS